MQTFVHPIKDPKQNRFHSAAPFGKDRLRAALIREGADELQGSVGCVLAVCIHHQHGVAGCGLVDVGRTNGRIAALSRSVVDQQDMKRTRIRSNGLIQPANEFPRRNSSRRGEA